MATFDRSYSGYVPEDAAAFAQGKLDANSEGTTPDSQQPNTNASTQQQSIDTNVQTTSAEVDKANPKSLLPHLNGIAIPTITESPKTIKTNDRQASRWDHGFEQGLRVYNLENKSIGENISDYNRWAKENGQKPLDIFEMIPYMQGKDLSKSLAQNEEDEKKLERQEKWERTGNFLAHLGSFVGAIAGGPAQDIESGAELTKRQRALRDATINQRNAYNNTMLQLYMKQQADERAEKMNEANIAYKQSMAEAKMRQLDIQEFRARTDKDFKDASIEIKRQLLDIQRDLAEGRISLMQAQEYAQKLKANAAAMNAGTNRMRAEGYDDVVTTTENGNEKQVKKEHRPRGSSGGNGRTITGVTWRQ